MAKLTLLTVLCILATGSLEEISNSPSESPSSNDNLGTTKELWFQQLGLRRSNGKPCPRRRNNNPDGWVPSYSSRIVRPLINEPTTLQPQALKNGDYKAGEGKLSVPTDNDQDLRQLSSLNSQNDDDDCDDQLDPDVENTALKILKDCLKKKQNKSARRSMSDPSLNDNGNNYAKEDSNIDDLIDDSEFDEDEESRRVTNFRPSLQDKQKWSDRYEIAGPIPNGELQTGQTSKNLRICYACSTATNPSCWEPNSRTTIKYCIKEHSCVTKTFGVKNQVTLIRDCANSCQDLSVPGIEPKYKTCNICHNDYCNSAMGVPINIYTLAIVLIISIVKCIY